MVQNSNFSNKQTLKQGKDEKPLTLAKCKQDCSLSFLPRFEAGESTYVSIWLATLTCGPLRLKVPTNATHMFDSLYKFQNVILGQVIPLNALQEPTLVTTSHLQLLRSLLNSRIMKQELGRLG